MQQSKRHSLSYCGIVKPFNTIAQIETALIAGTERRGRQRDAAPLIIICAARRIAYR